MDPRTKTNDKAQIERPTFPYADFQGFQVWDVLSSAIDDLVNNQDLVETTARKYIVGLIVSRLFEAGLVSSVGLEPKKI